MKTSEVFADPRQRAPQLMNQGFTVPEKMRVIHPTYSCLQVWRRRNKAADLLERILQLHAERF